MRLSYTSAVGFARAIDAVGNLVDEGQFKAKKDGLSLIAMDPSQISMVIFNMPKSIFSEYQSESEVIGLDINYFKKVLRRGKGEEKLTLETEENRLIATFEGGKRKKTFKIPLLDLTEGVSKEPLIEYRNNIKIRADVLNEVINDAKLISSHIRLVLTPDGFGAEVKSENGELRVHIEKDDEAVAEINVENGARASFPLQYLEDILKAAKSLDLVTLHLETDRPLKLEYNIEGAVAKYYLAPRIETE
ncbi:MAG: proliferating cell nuclear antigen (pcna) [Candidatus Anstonellales archaeon]